MLFLLIKCVHRTNVAVLTGTLIRTGHLYRATGCVQGVYKRVNFEFSAKPFDNDSSLNLSVSNISSVQLLETALGPVRLSRFSDCVTNGNPKFERRSERAK